MSETILQTRGLTKRFSRRILAVDGLDLDIPRGQVFGLLGPNGSGKTTTLGMILGVVAKTNGSYNWFGEGDHYHLRKRIGAILEQPNFYPFLSARQNLVVHSQIKDIRKPDLDGLLKMVGLYERSNDPFKTYSLGMKQRLAIASAMLANPDVLIFDEPTNGLDPLGIAEIRQLILDIRDMDKTIVLASHLLDEVQKVCSHFAVLRKGKKIYSGSVEEALRSHSTIAVAADDHDLLRQVLSQCPGVKKLENVSDVITFQADEGWTVAAINAYLVERRVPVNFIQQRKTSLEEKFLEILRENDAAIFSPPSIPTV
jgi:ABC-2 type transport system ATP-binding protein